MNTKRQDNQDLFMDYVIDEEKRKQILLSLTATDFSAIYVYVLSWLEENSIIVIRF